MRYRISSYKYINLQVSTMFPIFTMLSTTSRKFFKQSAQEPNLSHERSTYSAVAFLSFPEFDSAFKA